MIIYTDGACFGNPGPMGVGIVIYDSNMKLLAEISEYVGEGTNNVAEYTAVIRALETAKIYEPENVELRSDSELLINQLNGKYKIKDLRLRSLKRKIDELTENLKIKFVHIPREQNKEADKLSKAAVPKNYNKTGAKYKQQKL